MEQAGTAFVQVIPSMRGFHRTIGRQLRAGMGQVGQDSGRSFTRSMLASVNTGMKAIGAGITHTTRAIARAAQSIAPVDRAINGLTAGLRGTRLETTGMAGALNSMGLRAQTAISMARDGARDLAAGFVDSRGAASGLSGVLGSLGGVGARAFGAVSAPVQGLTSGLRGTVVEATGLTGAMNTTGLAVSTAFTHGRAQAQLFSAGLRGVGVSASESNSWMYRLGTTAGNAARTAAAGFSQVTDAIRSAGSRMGAWLSESESGIGGVGAALSRMGALGAAAVAAIGLGTLVSQVQELAMGAQTTEAQLVSLYEAAGGGASDVNELMSEMDSRFKHLDMSAMRQGATSLAYMGVQGGEAVDILENLEKATRAAGTGTVGLERAFAAMTSGVNAGKFQMGELNQISNAGIPIYDALADVLGVDISTAQQMASDGAIGLQEVLQAIDGDHGVWFPALLEGAENVGATFQGSWDAIKNSIVNGLSEQVVPLFDRAAPVMSRFAGAVETGFARLPGMLERVRSALVDSGIAAGFSNLVHGVRDLGSAAAPAVQPFLSTLVPALGAVFLLLGPVGDALQTAGGWMRENETVVKVLGATLGGLAAGLILVRGATLAAAAGKIILRAATIGLTAAIRANPIGALITALMALGAGLAYAYQNFDGFRSTVNTVASAVKTAALWIWDNGLQPAFNGIAAGARFVGGHIQALWNDHLQPVFAAIGDGAQWLWGHLTNISSGIAGLFSDPPTITEIGQALQNVGTNITAWLKTRAEELAGWLSSLPAMVGTALVTAGRTAAGWISEHLNPTALLAHGRDLVEALISGLSGLAGRMAERAREAGQAWLGWARGFPTRVRASVTAIGEAAISWARELPGRIREQLTAVGVAIVGWAQGLPAQVWGALSSALSTGGEWLSGLWDPAALVGAGRQLVESLIEGVSDLGSRMAEHAVEAGRAWLDWARDFPASVRSHVSRIGDAAVEWARDLPGRIREYVTETGDAAIEWAQDLPERIRSQVSEAGDAAVSWAQDLPAIVRERLGETATAVREWVTGLPETIRSWFDSGEASSWVADMRERVVEGLVAARDAVVEWARGLPEQIREVMDRASDVGSWLSEWGPKLVKGLGIAFLALALAVPGLLLALAGTVLFILGTILMEIGIWLWGKLTALMEQAGEAVRAKVHEITDRFREIRDSVVGSVSGMVARVVGFFVGLYESVTGRATALRTQVSGAFTAIREWVVTQVSNLRERAVAAFTALRDRATSVTQNLRDRVSGFFATLRDWIVQRVTSLRDRAVSLFTNARDRAVSVTQNLRDQVTNMFTNARDWVVDRATGLRDRVVGAMETLRDRTIRAFDRARAGIKTAWDKVESITRKPVSFVVNTVYNDGIRAVWNRVADLVGMGNLNRITGWATGGVLPGYTPGRDVHTFLSPTGGGLELSGGEAIMRPEWTRAVGPGWVNSMNRAARTGGASGVRSALGFASGGVIPTQRFSNGGLFGRIASFGSSLKDIVTGDGLSAAASAVLDPLMETMAGRFTEGRWAEAMVSVPKAIIGSLMEWFENVIGDMLGGDGQKVADIAKSYVGVSGNPNQFTRAFGMNGLPWCAMFVSEVIKEAKAQDAYNNIRSAAVSAFANSSMDSVTSVGATRPGDLAVYRGSGPGGWQHINIISDDNGGTVGGNESNGVRSYANYSARASTFMRPKFASGGIWQQNRDQTSEALTHPLTRMLRAGEDARLYDTGGWLMPGLTAVHNATGRPEAVLTPAQSEALVRLASRRGGGEGHTFNVYETRNARTTARSTVTALRDYESLHPTP